MSYNKTTWANGDVITAEKLNNIETGVEGANSPLIITLTFDIEQHTGIADKTFGEVRTAFENGRLVYLNIINNSNVLAGSSYIITKIDYTISEGGEFAFGSVETQFQDYALNASVEEAPYTLEALDALYLCCN